MTPHENPIFRIAECHAILVLFALSIFCWVPAATGVTLTTGTDTFVAEAAPDTVRGGGVLAEWDGSDGGGENHALLHFDIFLDEGGSVDPVVVTGNPDFRAYLRLEVMDPGNAGDLHRMTAPFDENSTWNTLGSGVVPGTNAELVADLTTVDMGTGFHEIEVTDSVAAWAAAPGTNFGWGIVPTGGNGLEFATFESGNGPILVLGVQDDLMPAGSDWKYYDAISAGDANYPVDGSGRAWNHPDFDDSGWPSGPGQLGYGDADEATTVTPSHITYLFRAEFSAGDTPDELILDLLRDDSAIVYLNGFEVVRDNLPAGAIDAATTASGVGPENNASGFSIDPVLLIPNDTNSLAVEIHNVSTSSSDISFDLMLRGIDHISPVPVPEPGAAVQLAVGLAALALLRLGRMRLANR